MNDAGGDGGSFGACPVPIRAYERVLLGHGGGGSLTQELIRGLFLPAFGAAADAVLEDGAELPPAAVASRLAMTTDSFVIHPRFFPGGDIGSLAVYGTVNDLVVGGAAPIALSASFVIEEGLAIEELRRVADSMGRAALRCGVRVVAGDTKVVERSKADGLFITTTGIGVVPPGLRLSIASARPGDCLIVSGSLGDHGVAIMAQREGLELETTLESDAAPLTELAALVLAAAPGARCMRDATRGGVGGVLHELAEASRVGVRLDDTAPVVKPAVAGACELLGLDPLYVANEGKLVACVPADEADAVLAALQQHAQGIDARCIATVIADHPGMVTARSPIGGERVLSPPRGELLPRIC